MSPVNHVGFFCKPTDAQRIMISGMMRLLMLENKKYKRREVISFIILQVKVNCVMLDPAILFGKIKSSVTLKLVLSLQKKLVPISLASEASQPCTTHPA